MSRRSRFTFRWVAVMGIIGGAAGLWWWRQSRAEGPVAFRTARIDRGTVEETVTATGALNAVVTVQVGSQVSGNIDKLGADFNSRVKTGQIIAQIDPTRFKANLAQAEATLKSAEASVVHAQVAVREGKIELDRAVALAAKSVIGAADLDAARSKYDQAVADLASGEAQVAQSKAQVGIARVDLEHCIIRAPIDGVVLQRAVDVGQTVAASLQAPVLFTIAQDLARMEVHAAIDEADIGKLHEGQEAHFSVDAYPGQSFDARIFQLRSQPTVTQNVVTYDAVLRVDNPDGKLRPGMTATVRVVSQRHDNVLRLPNSVLRFRPPAELVENQGTRPQRQAGAGGPGAEGAPGGEGRPRGGGGPAGGGQWAGGQGGPGGPGGQGSGAGRERGGRAYQAKGGKLVAIRFKGISDDEHTEVAGGPLHEGDEVVIDVLGPGGAPLHAPSNPTRGRGPRFF
jgi:HlyD family secretion protein